MTDQITLTDANGNPTGETITSAQIAHYNHQRVTGSYTHRGLGGESDIAATWYLSEVALKDGRIVFCREVEQREEPK